MATPHYSHSIVLDEQMHEALRGLRRHDSKSSNMARILLREALEGGANPNSHDENGKTPLEFLSTDPRASNPGGRRNNFDQAALWLFMHGADPTLPGCNFFGKHGFNIVRLCLKEIRRREQKTGLYLHDDQSPLHTLAEQNPGYIETCLKTETWPMWWTTAARKSDHQTPLHRVWMSNPPFQKEAQWRWKATKALMGTGGSLTATDRHGQTPAELIAMAMQTMKQNDLEYASSEILAQVDAVLQQHKMQRDTEPARRQGAGLRL